MRRIRRVVLLLLVVPCATATVGCNPEVETKVIAVKPNPTGEARAMLESYANGQPVSSEAAGYDDLVARLKAADPAKGEAFAKFVDETRKAPAGVPERAKKLLENF